MVKTTFLNLAEEKKHRVSEALLTEFSDHNLKDAQVARIVKDAGIARGAFYKYFENLTDAYQYLFRQAIKEIHMGIRPKKKFDPEFYYQEVINFIDSSQNSRYAKLMKRHLLYNQSVLPKKSHAEAFLKMPTQDWIAMVLSHQVINDILINPEYQNETLKRFKESLELLKQSKKEE